MQVLMEQYNKKSIVVVRVPVYPRVIVLYHERMPLE